MTYDEIGNLTSDGTYTYTWQAGRQLAGMMSADKTITFEYDHNGLRVRKSVNGVVTNYTYNGRTLVHLSQGTNELHFYYDAQGRPAAVDYNGTMLHYQHTLQGDIIGIVNSAGKLAVEYNYGAWGEPKGRAHYAAYAELETLNPFRYRGYVFDEETGLYYLQSRYYNPTWGRFISADILIGKIRLLIGHDIFCYCSNRPIISSDHSGKNFIDDIIYRWLYSSQIDFWTTVSLSLRVIGHTFSAEFLEHSIQTNPKAKHYHDGTDLVEKIKKDKDFKEKFEAIVKAQEYYKPSLLSFDYDDDLFGSIHRANIFVNPYILENEIQGYYVCMTDVYNFEYNSDYIGQSKTAIDRFKRIVAITGNNLAELDMNSGAIRSYYVFIEFYIDIE